MEERKNNQKQRKSERNGAVRLLSDMRTSQRGMRAVAIVALIVSAVISAFSVMTALSFVQTNKDNLYVLEEGSVLELRRARNGEQKDLQVVEVVTRFHELFYNIAPNMTTINANVDRAMNLADESAQRVYDDLKEQSYYTYMIQNNIMQEIYVDSVKVNVMTYPYTAEAFCSLYVHRETKDFFYKLNTRCEVLEVPRTHKNPNGLMLTRYEAEDPVLVGSQGR